jgi:hypothetical protein
MTENIQKKPRLGLIAVGLFFLIVPGVNVYDIFPDFIAYFIFSTALSYAADRAPYFAEAKDAFFKLGAVTLIKIPASLAMSFIRSGNVADSDIRSLFSLTFAVIEFILIVCAVRNLFLGFTYLGERTSNSSLISDFPINGKKTRKMSTDGLRNLTYVFAFYRCLMYFVPELLLLTRGVSAEEYFTTFNVAKLYPYAVIFAILSVFAFALFWQSRMKKLLRMIKIGGGLNATADMLMSEERRVELEESKRLSGMKLALSALAVAAILSSELRLENLRNVDLLPSFIFGFVIMLCAVKLGSFVGKKRIAYIYGGIYTGIAFAAYLFDFHFFKDHSYEVLSLLPEARRAYLGLIIVRALETVAFAVMLSVVCILLLKFIKEHTGILPESDGYSRQDRDYHKKLTTIAYISCGSGILSQILRLTDCIFKYYTKNILVDVENSIGTVSQGLIPWFGVVVLISELFYIGFTLYAVSVYKDEVELKYSYN